MLKKWYTSTLIIILALIGLNQGQTKVPNQQIVIQFDEQETTLDTSYDDVLVAVTQKLQDLGITNIEIIEDNNTQLSIRYYSDIDALSVTEFLSQNCELLITYKDADKLPFDPLENQFPENCSLVVSDLQQQTNDGLNKNGKFAFELKQEYNRFSNPITIYFNDKIGLEQDAIVHLAYKINSAIAIAITNASHTIPEVRAGPNMFLDCQSTC